ncbi:MAG: group III truncated hemoglobin [Vicingus serpentipes]|nr:group III truncated hemoglobin [Vicingus serpentipes]
MRDIETKEDLSFLMNAFYSKMLKDKEIGYIFTEVAQLDLEKHLPSLTNFWENMLLQPNGYKKNIMDIHLQLNGKEKLMPQHFERWLFLLNETVTENFKGEKVTQMLNSSKNIAAMMQYKMDLT